MTETTSNQEAYEAAKRTIDGRYHDVAEEYEDEVAQDIATEATADVAMALAHNLIKVVYDAKHNTYYFAKTKLYESRQ